MTFPIKTLIYLLSCLLLLAGAVSFFSGWSLSPYLFAIGTAGVSVCYFTLSTAGMDFRSKRLHHFNVIAGILMLVSSGLMFNNRKEWVLCLFIAAILQLYAAFASPQKKE